ncbi:cytochrome C oxidase subunit IV family protein [Peribacillus asahii]|nr:cytochrome C oxidase subunit IV family protein [Peribacillus asahii]
MIVLLATAFVQSGVQVVMFMHARESEDKASIYAHIWYSVFLAVINILESLLCMVWAYEIPRI